MQPTPMDDWLQDVGMNAEPEAIESLFEHLTVDPGSIETEQSLYIEKLWAARWRLDYSTSSTLSYTNHH